MSSMTHPQNVRRLYKTILRLHRGLPEEIRVLGDDYTKSEFKRHKDADVTFVPVFMKEWAKYAADLSKQLGIQGSHKAKPIGKDLHEESLDYFTEEQLSQLFTLYEASSGKKENS